MQEKLYGIKDQYPQQLHMFSNFLIFCQNRRQLWEGNKTLFSTETRVTEEKKYKKHNILMFTLFGY